MTIDPNFQAWAQPMNDYELTKRQAHLLAEGCRAPLQARGKQGTPKTGVIRASKTVKEGEVQPLPCMLRNYWKPRHLQRAKALLATIPQSEHLALDILLAPSGIFATTGLQILTNFTKLRPEQRQLLCILAQSPDPCERSLARTLAAKQEPEPGPQTQIVGNLIRGLEAQRQQLTTWQKDYPQEPWSAQLDAIAHTLAALLDQLRAIAQRAEAAHQQRMAPHVEAFQS